MPAPAFDPARFCNPRQVGGVRTARYDWPDAGGAPGCRVAIFETGTPLRFVVNLDRGGDIVEASFGGMSLAWLSSNGYAPPGVGGSPPDLWMRGWNGGLVTTCGPDVIGRRADAAGETTELHGGFNHRPAAVTAIRQPDPAAGQLDFGIDLVIRDTRLFGPDYEVQRTVSATLGTPGLRIEDEVRNVGNQPAEHHWLYHINLGYPLIDEGTQIVLAGENAIYWGLDNHDATKTKANWKTVPAPLSAHRGSGERGVVLSPPADADGQATVGVIHPGAGIGLRLRYDPAALPRLANWQHFGPGEYVTGLEPFAGQLLPADADPHAKADPLEPGETRRYGVAFDVLTTADALNALRSADGTIRGA